MVTNNFLFHSGRVVDNNFLVTIYLVNHNYGRFVQQAIDSIYCQSYRPIELIIIDDGSSDESRTVIENELLGRIDNSISVSVIHQDNKGLTKTNNVALRLANGDFIMRLDADDWLAPEAVEKMVGRLIESPDKGLVFCDYFEVDEQVYC